MNGQQSSTKTIIKTGDAIQLIEGQDGLPATATIRDIVDQAVIKTITIQETKYVIEPKITVNGSSVSMDALVNDRDIIAYEIAETVEDVFTLTNNTNLLKQFESYVIYVDGKPLYLPAFSANLLINGKPGKLSYAVQHNDIITFPTIVTNCTTNR
ncbi:Cell division protein OS=Lysinibacillus sphaericus OX=1421 GN=LS41612_06195 PE=4 SV=1 [Lysinibacillus sphaericus]